MIRAKTIFHIIREFDLIDEAKRQEHDDHLERLDKLGWGTVNKNK